MICNFFFVTSFVILRTANYNVKRNMNIKILGTGCPRCKTLEREVIDSLAELNIPADVSKVDDIMKIMEYGIMHTPALVIDEKVILSGRVPAVSELKEIITKYQK